ncbi:MAG: acetylglutamate kinase [Epulopiscium sp. Nele67-Bin001]|nr:MAG: acetylglutamate kinase [Epulopiscium sp. Nuni2H_MBin001]OON93171.1 MAG: acetylglutamate kinase [Epulopiscium sp. Nele67-Bin001]
MVTILTEALSYIEKYIGKTIVIKYGGNAMLSPELKQSIVSDIVLLHKIGVKVVLVHGGGPDINDLFAKLGKTSTFIDGLRYTDDDDIDYIQMVLCGKTNKELVSLIGKAGAKAVGISGLDAQLTHAVKLEKYGNVGEITHVDPSIVKDLLEKNYLPVVSSVAYSNEGSLNINADLFAAKLSIVLRADHFMLLTDVKGVMRDPKDEDTLISSIKVSQVPQLIKEGIISGGMIPKVDCCTLAVRNGVKQTSIQQGTQKHSILLELLSDEGSGTLFY